MGSLSQDSPPQAGGSSVAPGVGDTWYGTTTADTSASGDHTVHFDSNYGAEVDSFTSAPLTAVEDCVVAMTITCGLTSGTGPASIVFNNVLGPNCSAYRTLDGTEAGRGLELSASVVTAVTAGFSPEVFVTSPAGVAWIEILATRIA